MSDLHQHMQDHKNIHTIKMEGSNPQLSENNQVSNGKVHKSMENNNKTDLNGHNVYVCSNENNKSIILDVEDQTDCTKGKSPILDILQNSENEKKSLLSFENDKILPVCTISIQNKQNLERFNDRNLTNDRITEFLNNEKTDIHRNGSSVINICAEQEKFPVFPVRRRRSSEPTIMEEDEDINKTESNDLPSKRRDSKEPAIPEEISTGNDMNKTVQAPQIVPPRRRGSNDSNKSSTTRRSSNGSNSGITNGKISSDQSERRQSDEISKPVVGCAESGVLKPKQTLTSQTNEVILASGRQPLVPVRGRIPCASDRRLSNDKHKLPPMSSMEEENLRERIHASLLKQCAENVHSEPRYNRDTFKRLFQSKEFLEQLFKLFDQDRDNLLYQDQWIEFLKERLSDEKQIDFAEQIESVAYVLCGDDPITLERFNQIFHAKGIVDKLFRLVDQGNIGSVSAEEVMEFVSNITNTRPRTGFDKKSLESLEQLFRQTVGNEKEIRREDFQKIVISKNPFFTERVFQIFDKDNSGSISLQEFLDSMHQFAGQSPDDKIKFLFKIYDIDGDGLIQHRELQHVMRACMEENGMQFSEEQIDDLTVAMFEDADTNNRGAITYEALKNQLEKHGGLLENLSISIDRWLVPPKPKAQPTSILGKLIALRPYQLTRPYWKNNHVYLSFLAIFVILNLGLFISRAIQYGDKNGYVIVARACGQCLNFNCMFVLVLMLRQCITFLRTRGFSSILPLDNHIYLHKMTGMLIAFLSVLHTFMHLLNFSVLVVNDPVVNEKNFTLVEWLLTDRPKLYGLVPGWANPTGIILFFILLIIFICSQAFVRRGGCFEIFYWTHLLYIPFWVLLIFHGPNFWKWFLVPGLIYLIERLLRLAWMQNERGKTYISSGLLLPSKVTHLVIKRPIHFDFHPGDYVFVNIPAIAKYEWHPFTISSAPEQEDYMWLHIRAVGEWTNRLYNYFEKEQEKLHNGEIPPLCSNNQTDKKVQLPTITNDTNTLKRLQASIKRKFSNRDPSKNRGDAQLVRYTHERFTSENAPHVSASDGEINNRACSSNETINYPVLPKAMSTEKRLQMLLFNQKVPLEKSLSMPDIQTRAKKRERLLVLREYMRSESEKSFDECQIRRARLQSLGLAYLSPQNKSLAQSFRYMRHKPTIIAFKTPSLENCDARNSSSSLGSVGRQTSAASFTSSPERQAEEGKCVPSTEHSPATTSLKPVNYPVGKPLEIYLDGPYGAPSSHIFRAQHAVLIATGIGVTPFASILQSIMHRYWKARHLCPKCKFSWASEIPPTVMNLRKVDFFWINRDQRSFEWFVNLLSQLEIEQAELGGAMERFLEMHMYITSALQKTDMKAVGLQLALDLLHEKEKRDLITGLKTRTNAGRPNWDKVFKQLQDQKKGKVTVFYCGPPQLGRILRYKCDQYGFSFRKETF